MTFVYQELKEGTGMTTLLHFKTVNLGACSLECAFACFFSI